MLIPKNTVVILNAVSIYSGFLVLTLIYITMLQWTMHMDPERYPEPEKFNVRILFDCSEIVTDRDRSAA